MHLAWPFAAALSLFAGQARADALPEPPEDCPPGSEGGTSHCDAGCYALTCADDVACPEGTTCQSTKACIRELDCFPNPIPVHGGDCSPGDTCRGDRESCQTIKLCLPGGDTTSSGSDTGNTSTSTSTSNGAETESTSTSTSTSSTSSTSSATSSGSSGSTSSGGQGSSEATPTTGAPPGTTGGGASSSTGAGSASDTAGGGGGGDKAGCGGCDLAEGPQGILALLVIVGVRRRRSHRPVSRDM